MKNELGLLITLLVFIGICIGGYYIHHNANHNYQVLTISALQEKINNKDSFILYIESKKLTASNNFSKVLKLITEKNSLKVYYIDIDALSNSDFALLFNVVSIDSAPTLAFITNGIETSVSNRVVGYTDDETTRTAIINGLTANDYIN